MRINDGGKIYSSGRRLSIPVLALAFALVAGCSENSPFTGQLSENTPPVIELTNGPVEGDSIEYRVHFYWIGDDEDGTVDHYQVALVSGRPVGFDPEDTTGADKWRRTLATDSVIVARADEFSNTTTINSSLYAVYSRTHTLFIRAVDDRGAVSEPAYRSFTAWTLAPHAFITEPANVNPDGGPQNLSPIVRFRWYGKDPIDSPWNYQNVDSTRYLYTNYSSTIVRDLNTWPENFELLWSEWLAVDAPGDSGVTTIIGDDELIPTGRSYIFAVQAKDDAGAISSVFDVRTNVRAFMVRPPTGPRLDVYEPFLGQFSFLGYDLDPRMVEVPPGFEMNFRWTADASSYGALVSTFRYGWDISDFNDPAQWSTLPNPEARRADAKTFYSGTHMLYIESVDNLGVSTFGCIEVTVIPVVLERDLMWVDDYRSTDDFIQTIYAQPTEKEHDEFWTNICLRVPDFVPQRDIFDCAANVFSPPPMSRVFQYKNIIWTFNAAVDYQDGAVWTRLVRFGNTEFLNFLPYYMAFGGHLWTLGQSERTGGLAAVIPGAPHGGRQYPNHIKCNLYTSDLSCEDTTGVFTLIYRDYCVTVLDKIEGVLKTWIPFARSKELDAISYCVLDHNDPVTGLRPGFPEKLVLWSKVTEPGMFFDPSIRGFHYAEVFNPSYWMNYVGAREQSCFHPIYRMRARINRSVLDNQVVAFWTTKYAHVAGPVEGSVAAPSVHFGLPLWFFNRAQVDSIADVIFETWQIN